jgi:hypothetical protein
VIKDSWGNFGLKYWEEKLNARQNTFCLVSSPSSRLDWYYAWFSLDHKIPVGLYGYLKIHSPLFPIWDMLTNRHKLNALNKSMPPFPLKENMDLRINHYRFSITEILESDFPSRLHDFLLKQGFESSLTTEINSLHQYFVSMQQQNLALAQRLSQGERWEPRNIFDKILFRWLDTNPWEGLE